MMASAEQNGHGGRKDLLTLDQRNSSNDLFISISGLIGAGKTTLANKLGEKMGLPCFHEPVIDNTYLADFYRDPSRYSFPLQVSLVWPGSQSGCHSHRLVRAVTRINDLAVFLGGPWPL